MNVFRRFLFFSFLLFLIGFGLAGLLVTIDAPQFIVYILKVVMAWTPNVAFVIIYRRLGRDISVWRSIGNLFTVRVRLVPLLLSILVPVVAVVSIGLLSALYLETGVAGVIKDVSVGAALLMFLHNLIQGPLGEEVGWRGYALTELKKRFSTVASSLILGVIWGLWHLPLWFVSGYSGVDLLLYIVFFMVSIVSLSLIIGVVYQGEGNNLIYAVLLHQMFNYTLQFLDVDLLIILGAASVVYAVLATGFGLYETWKPSDKAVRTNGQL